jgi:arylsulfatase A-like enzyme
MFTGRYPHETSAGLNRALDSACPTLAEELGGLGYATGGFVANFACCNAQYGVARGFARYHDAPGAWNRAVTPLELARSSRLGGWLMDRVFHVWKPEKEVYTTAEDARSINSRALDWIARQHHAGRPFFAFLNYMDAHGPYRIPADATRRFTVKDQDERIEAARRAVETRAGELAKVRLTHESAREYQELEAHFARVRTDAYDEAIGWIDSQIDSLLGELESRGLLENTVVIVTSDHGEMFGEHGGMTLHGHSLYRELTHVPLLILGAKAHPVPGGAAVSEVVSTRDIPATVLTLVGADTTAKRWPGRSLSRFWSDTQSAANLAAEPVYFEMEDLQRPKAQKNWPASSGPIWAVADSRHTYMRQLVWKGGEPGSLREELYRADDPAESRNLVNDPASGGELARLRPLLDHFILEIKRIESK